MNAHDRELVAALICPICRTGPWRSLGIHVAKKHDLDARAFKEQVGLGWSASLNAPDVAEAQRVRAVQQDLVAALRRVPHARGSAVSDAGRQGRATGAGVSAAQRSKIPREAGPVIQARLDGGELMRHVAQTYGCTVSAVSLFMKAWRRRAAQQTAPDSP